MANIRTFRDLPRDDPQQNDQTAFFSAVDVGPDIRCIDMFFPGFTWKSTCLWISAIDVVLFIITVIAGSHGLNPTRSVLRQFGALYAKDVAAGQVWRLLTPVVLHASLIHLVFNVYYQMRMGLSIERLFGHVKTLILYVASAVLGNIFSAATNPCALCVGASTASFGLIGSEIAYIALKYHRLNGREEMMVLRSMTTFLIYCILMSMIPNSQVDWRGHLGGFIAGFCICIIFCRSAEDKPTWYNIAFATAITLLAVLPIAGLLMVFLFNFDLGCAPISRFGTSYVS